jgi:hypothetical protein
MVSRVELMLACAPRHEHDGIGALEDVHGVRVTITGKVKYSAEAVGSLQGLSNFRTEVGDSGDCNCMDLSS